MTTPTTILDYLLARFPGAKKNTLREMVETKRVLINAVAVKSLKQVIAETDKVEIRDTAGVSGKPQTLDENLKLIYQDADLLIVDKPSGLLTATHDEEHRKTVLEILNQHVRKANQKSKAHLVHRIDRDASGLLVFARNENAFNSLKEQFYKHTITRQYDVLVHGVPKKPQARLEHTLQEDPASGRVTVTRHARLGKHAVLEYQVLASARGFSHVRCTLETGRKHQIRVQLQAIGHPIAGDPVYGDATDKTAGGGGPIGRLALHASLLAFQHPRTKTEVRFTSPMPRQFANALGL